VIVHVALAPYQLKSYLNLIPNFAVSVARLLFPKKWAHSVSVTLIMLYRITTGKLSISIYLKRHILYFFIYVRHNFVQLCKLVSYIAIIDYWLGDLHVFGFWLNCVRNLFWVGVGIQNKF
jgi:hypothetical protein